MGRMVKKNKIIITNDYPYIRAYQESLNVIFHLAQLMMTKPMTEYIWCVSERFTDSEPLKQLWTGVMCLKSKIVIMSSRSPVQPTGNKLCQMKLLLKTRRKEAEVLEKSKLEEAN
jgi:hypothetical protein